MSKLFVFSRVNVIKDFILVFIIFAIPFLFFLYMLSPQDVTEWKTIFFHINLSKTGDIVNAVLWYFSYKLLTILIFSIWFVTCKHWWRYLILVPVLFEVYKFSAYYYDLNHYLINYKSYFIIIVCLPLIFLLLYISIKLNYYSSSKSINKQIDEEITLMMQQVSNYKKEDYREFKSKLILLRKQKLQLEKKEYLIQLIKLREDFAINTQNK